ncbi:MAG: S-layer homology domain-containing protein [Nitrospirota bacterium]
MTTKFASRLFAALLAIGVGSVARGQATLTNLSSLPRLTSSGARPDTYGTVKTSYLTIFDTQFSPLTSATTYGDQGVGAARASRYATASPGALLAPVNLPNGALLVSLEIDACDSNAADKHLVGILGSCDMVGNNCAGIGSLITTVSNPIVSCTQYTQDLTSLNYTVDNLSGRLFVEAVMAALDNTNSISGAVIGYKLQVGQPPVAATFSDVPTSHTYFRAIEALAASGITSGCGGGNFCPNQAVTRGEMAKFLANALGLQFP